MPDGVNPPFEDPHWPRAAAWLAGESHRDAGTNLAVIGGPLNRSITPGRCDLAPAAVRRALHRLSTFDLASGQDVRAVRASDLGDLPIVHASPEDSLATIKAAVKGASASSEAIVLLGGDNGVTRPGVHALGLPLDKVGLLTIDAHLDLRTTEGGLHNGNPVRALIEDGLPGENVVQVGIAPFANSQAYFEYGRSHGCTIVPLDDARAQGLAKTVADCLERLAFKVEAIYVDADVDALDRAFAPACPGARPGGFTPREMARACFEAGKNQKVKAMDIVELDPEKDINDSTCLAAGQFLLSFACGLAARRR